MISATAFRVVTAKGIVITFHLYLEAAPVTCHAFLELLPFKRRFMHARVSGEEIWTDDPPPLEIIQENASVFAEPGEVVFGPAKPSRAKTANCMGIYYGNGRGLDACNIFAKCVTADLDKLAVVGRDIWVHGGQDISIEATE